MRLPVPFRLLGRKSRRQRIDELLDQLAAQEEDLRNTCAALLDITDKDDELALEIARFLDQLDR